MASRKCEFCKKKKLVTMMCTCQKTFCLAHYSPDKHECCRILEKDIQHTEEELTATGAFKKIDKI